MRWAVVGFWLAAGCLCGGCETGLPRVRAEWLENRMRAIPAGSAPVYAWRARRGDLKTYWDDQAVTIRARAWLPPDWNEPGDGCWEVEGRNHEGKAIPFLGVVRSFTNEQGSRLSEVVPKFDLDEAPDGLYLALLPGVTKEDGRVVSIRPAVLLREIRDHVWKPFSVRIPLRPEQESPVTPPPPETKPAPPKGTPIPVT